MDASRNRTELERIFATQREGTREQVSRSYEERMDLLGRLGRIFEQHRDELVDAVAADFGIRSRYETILLDLMLGISEIKFARRNLKTWLRPRRVKTDIFGLPGSSRLVPQPLGVVGVLGTWNYPLGTIFVGAAGALAAGNRVIAKPSEVSANAAEASERLVRRYFAEEEFAIVQGGPDMAQAMTALPFDHILFTGSPAVGRKVYEAAAANLTPVTLELGGKCPAIVGKGASLAQVCESLVFGKLLNAGQTCIAPDYVMVPRGKEAAFGEAFGRAVARLFPTIEGNPDYAAIISPRHHERLQALLAQARAEGARLQPAGPDAASGAASSAGSSRQMAPVLAFNVAAGSKLLTEEIFGPILPVLPYDTMQDAINYINAHPRPLALYWFGTDTDARDKLLASTVSGGVTVNDTLMHIAHENLPFGGVGDSGWGSYHGEAGFLRMTQQKAVLVQSKWARGDLFYPPYGKRFEQVMGLLKRII